MVGMRDVAKRAGVSVSSVSLVINGTGYVSPQMREKVERAMRELDYTPNELARNFYHGRTGLVGVIVPSITHPFFSTLTAQLQREFATKGLRTMLCSTADASHGESEYVDMLRRQMVDALVVAAHTTHDADYWTGIGRPVVAFDRILGTGIPAVCSDHVQGGNEIADLLLATGARHVVMIGGPRRQFHDADRGGTTFPTVRYMLTLEERLDQAGVRHDYLDAGELDSFEGYRKAAHAAFDRFPDMDAVIGADVTAALCVQEALARGISIPDRLQVIAYDGTFAADIAGLNLTAVKQDCPAIAAALAQLTAQQIETSEQADRNDAGVVNLPVSLVPASTTR